MHLVVISWQNMFVNIILFNGALSYTLIWSEELEL
jgi:hypothetical protein